MLASRLLLVPAFALVSAAGGEKSAIVFAPAAGTTLQRSCSSDFRLELEALALSFNGDEVPAEYLGEVGGSMAHQESFVVTDVLETVADGRATRLRRRFDELAAKETTTFEGEDGEETSEEPYESELEGKEVVFEWDEESGAHTVDFAEGVEGDEALLEELEEDMDLRGLLPGHEVEPGERWEIDVSVFDRLMSPGGDLALRGEDDEGDEEDSFEENLEGSFVATFRGVESVDGARLAVVELVVEVTTYDESESTEQLTEDAPEGLEATTSQRMEFAIEVAGELRWDLEHGHLVSLELAGDMSLRMVQAMSGEMEGESFEQVQTMEFVGPLGFRFEVERP